MSFISLRLWKNTNIFFKKFHKYDKAFALDLYLIYNRLPLDRICTSDKHQLLMLYLHTVLSWLYVSLRYITEHSCISQFYRLVATCQFRQVGTSLLRSGLLQVVICRLDTTFWNKLQQACWTNQLATNLLTTCNRLVVASCRKPCERILISTCCNKMLQDVNRLVSTCAFLAV